MPLTYYVANGPNGPCLALGPANPAPNATVADWLTTVNLAPCPPTPGGSPPPPPLDPAAFAVQFWQTVPLPRPAPAVPPGYGICGKTAYLTTRGSTTPAPFVENTPLGALTIQAVGTYTVDWGDTHSPGPQGPYPYEGQTWPDGRITHTYDWAGTYGITVTESWTATWRLAGASGTLAGLHTTATIPGFRVEQLEAVLVN